MAVVTQNFMTQSQATRLPAWQQAGLPERVAGLMRLWHVRRRERQTYASLGHRELREIGLSQWAVEQELAKPFWRG